MNEYTRRTICTLLSMLVVVASLALVIYGQQTVGYANLAMMLLGVAGILLMLYLYNRSFTHLTPEERGVVLRTEEPSARKEESGSK